MSKEIVVTKHGQAEELKCMGAAVRFLCGAQQTGRGWSLGRG